MVKKYRPSNGSEGRSFETVWCDKCARIVFDIHTEEYLEDCEIFMKTLIYDADEPEYPEEWRYCPLTNIPICTAFITEPEPIPPDPNQLGF